MPRLLDALAVLRRMRARLANGWCQGTFVMDPKTRAGVHYTHALKYPEKTANYPCCLLSAQLLAGVYEDTPLGSTIRGYLMEAAHALHPQSTHGNLTGFNDSPKRTAAEVLAVVDHAIAAVIQVLKSEHNASDEVIAATCV